MKNRYIVSSFMALALLWGCVPDSRDFDMPDSAVYFVDNAANNGVQPVVMYDVQSEVESPVYVYQSGIEEVYTGEVSVSLAEDYIETYNELNGTSLKALPENCYTLLNTTASIADRKARFALKFDVEAVKALAAEEDVDLSEYVVALALASKDLEIATYKDNNFGYYLAAPDLRNATAKISGSVLEDKKIKLVVELPFDNQWDFTFDISYDVTGTFGLDTKRGNRIPAKYSCTPAPADFIEKVVVEGGEFKLGPGTNMREYTITAPAEYSRAWAKGQTNNFAVSIKNARLTVDGVEKEVPVEGATFLAAYDSNLIQKYIKTATNYENRSFNAEQLQYYTKVLSEYGLNTYNDRDKYVWNPQGSQDQYLDRWYNGNGYGWKAPWSGGFGPRNQIPLWVHIDMKKVQAINGCEWWRRGDGNVGDTKRIEVYAIDDCTYTWKGSDLTYAPDAITYLGTLDFGGRENAYTLGASTLDYIETQHLMFYIVESTRSNASDCAELVFWY